MKPTTADQFVTADLAGNLDKIDAAPGITNITSSTRPTDWGAAHNGMFIYERDTGLTWRWTGAAFVRAFGTGLLKKSNGDAAYNSRDTNFSTANSTTSQVALSLTNVVVPAGLRPLMVEANIQQLTNSGGGNTFVYLRRGTTAASTPLLNRWVAPDNGGGIYVARIDAGLAAGNYDFSIQLQVVASGTSNIVANSGGGLCEIRVFEL